MRSLDGLKATLDWYFERYHRTDQNLGTGDTFVSPALVGHFAVTPKQFERGAAAALLKVFIACTFFQKRQDQQVLRILQGMGRGVVRGLTDAAALGDQIDASGCECLRSVTALAEACGLTKEGAGGRGTCQWRRRPCHLKEHTVAMKRYGHFGKIPSSAILMLREHGVDDLPALHRRALSGSSDREARARWLQTALMKTWRVSEKISAMFLSAVSNPDLGRVAAPWLDGLAWEQFVVIDSNTDLYLGRLCGRLPGPYEQRRAMLLDIAGRVDLRQHGDVTFGFNPRLVQQAMYVFTGKISRKANGHDCCHDRAACARCPVALRRHCPVSAAR